MGHKRTMCVCVTPEQQLRPCSKDLRKSASISLKTTIREQSRRNLHVVNDAIFALHAWHELLLSTRRIRQRTFSACGDMPSSSHKAGGCIAKANWAVLFDQQS